MKGKWIATPGTLPVIVQRLLTPETPAQVMLASEGITIDR